MNRTKKSSFFGTKEGVLKGMAVQKKRGETKIRPLCRWEEILFDVRHKALCKQNP